MVNGLYSAASGLLRQQKNISVISNNIANVSTTGFKGQTTVGSSFGEHLISRIDNRSKGGNRSIGSGAFLTINSTEFTDFNQGPLEETGRSVDMAILGEGFFLIDSEYGEALTRNGQFAMDSEGYLTLPGSGRVLNDNRNPVRLSSAEFTVDSQGRIYEEGEERDQLFIGKAEDNSQMAKAGENLYLCNADIQRIDPEEYRIVQGSLEKANLNLAQEMSKIIAGQSHFQSNSQIVKIYDKINEITVNQIGRIG